ncbi:MAG: TetM/TetW/TetO/TetS family tetracycline resistance ribosomal protection protein [Oscillospiraceae bacterium]|nr:TetM/TetW/TetO/TetS family tetracycline resistance ribosomal protection protein [Oscillospiraceae bacterium]
MNRLVIGILAHVDSGKTTLSEAMLYTTGEVRKLGRVDHGDAFLDTNQIERDRGITIFSKQAIMKFGGTEFTLLDTPGHIDFSTETERTLSVLDYAILVISGTDGVQNHTETLWRLLERYNVPVFLFINKMDLHADYDSVINELKHRFGDGCIDFERDLSDEGVMDELSMRDEAIMNSFLENGSVKTDDIRNAIVQRKIFPCFFGSALKLTGVEEFLKGLELYTRRAIYDDNFGARVFKIAEDTDGTRLTYMKITGGSLKVRDQLTGNKRNEWSEKVNQIRIYSGAKYQTVDEALPGMVCAVTGLSQTYPGEGIGCMSDAKSAVLESVLTYKAELPEDISIHNALLDLRRLEQEDPQLHIIWNEQLQEIHVQVMGEVQLEVLTQVIADRFGFDVHFTHGSIAYKETIAAPVEGVGHYEPLRHYAEVHLLMEPAEKGSGLQFAVDCSEDMLDRNWQRLILTHLKEKQHIGVLTGSPITDMKITLIAGRAHQKHTEGGDFRQATYRAVRQGLKMAQSILLEPYYEFRLELPSENVGRAMTDIQQMGGTFEQNETYDDMTVISGSAPVSAMRDYGKEVIGYTGGKGRLNCILSGYEPCADSEKVISEIGYNSESDLENPADSVFCSHGAGFTVKWDKVYDYMHLDGISFDEEADDSEEENLLRAEKYLDMVADDNELMQIFERTYGPVTRKASSYTVRKTAVPQKKHTKAKPLPKGPEYLLVDGYNIIFAWDNLKEIAKSSLNSARDALIDILCNYQGFTQCELILVFDAYKVKGNTGSVEKIHNINVVYTKEAETADMYIEKTTHKLAGKHRVRVATSDSLEQIIILGSGAIRVSASEFLHEVKIAEKAIMDIISQT